jgi:hypothetical protein
VCISGVTDGESLSLVERIHDAINVGSRRRSVNQWCAQQNSPGNSRKHQVFWIAARIAVWNDRRQS